MSTTTAPTTPLLNPTNTGRRRSGGLGNMGQTTTTIPDPRCMKAMIVLELMWKALIVAVAIVVVDMSKDVSTKVPLKVWVVGYAVLRVLSMIYVCIDYWRWREANRALFRPLDASFDSRHLVLDRVTNWLQLVKSMLNVIWWIVGLYWMFSGGKTVADDAPKLFWFTAIFLALDLFIVSIFICIPCITCIATWCCLSHIMSTLSTASRQNVAVDDLIERLSNNSGILAATQESSNGVKNERDTSTPIKQATSAEDAV